MAINPNIPLAALQGTQRLGNALTNLGSTVGQIKQSNRLADLQERQFGLQKGNLELQQNQLLASQQRQAQETRIKEGVFAAKTIEPFIKAGDVRGAINALEQQKRFFGQADIVNRIQQGLSSENGLQFGQELVPNFIRRGEAIGLVKAPSLTTTQKDLIAAGIDPASEEGRGIIKRKLTKPQAEVNLNQEALSVEKEESAKLRARKFDEIRQAGFDASDKLDALARLEQIDIESGALEPAKVGAARLFNALGVDGDKLLGVNVANAQAFNSVSETLLNEVLNKAKGPQTDRDAERVRNTLPRLAGEQESKDFIVQSLKATALRQVEMAEFFEDWAEENDGSTAGANKAWNRYKRSTPMVSNFDTAQGRPIFFHQFRDKVIERNPGVSEQEIFDEWRRQNKVRK